MKKSGDGLKRVVIIDDHPLLRRGLERLISSGNRFTVCGEAGDAAAGIELIRKEKPGLAIVDIGLPDLDGVELTRQIVAKFPDIHVLILSMHDESDYALRAFSAGATGYMVKSEAAERIETALEEVWNGRPYLSASIPNPPDL